MIREGRTRAPRPDTLDDFSRIADGRFTIATALSRACSTGGPTTVKPATLRREPSSLYRVEGGPFVPPGSAEWLFARSGRGLRVAKFLPAGSVRGSVVLSTGRTEPIEKYGEVAADLVSRGFAVLTHDW